MGRALKVTTSTVKSQSRDRCCARQVINRACIKREPPDVPSSVPSGIRGCAGRDRSFPGLPLRGILKIVLLCFKLFHLALRFAAGC